jgi:hypothetical protein
MHDARQITPLRRIETRAVMTNGKIVTGWYSYPMGTGQSTLAEIDEGLARAYGRGNYHIVATYRDGMLAS